MDRENGIYADHTKVHPIHFEGKYFKCRVPLNNVRSPQGRPVFVQASAARTCKGPSLLQVRAASNHSSATPPAALLLHRRCRIVDQDRLDQRTGNRFRNQFGLGCRRRLGYFKRR